MLNFNISSEKLNISQGSSRSSFQKLKIKNELQISINVGTCKVKQTHNYSYKILEKFSHQS